MIARWSAGTNLEADSKLYFMGYANVDTAAVSSQRRSFVDVSWQPEADGTSLVTVTIAQPDVQDGGTLSVLLPPTDDDITSPGKLLYRLKYGYMFDILSAETHVVFPEYTVKIDPWPEQTVVMPPESITCTAVGNPLPTIQVYKTEEDGTVTDLTMGYQYYVAALNAFVRYHPIRLNEYVSQIPNVSETFVQDPRGNYTCRYDTPPGLTMYHFVDKVA